MRSVLGGLAAVILLAAAPEASALQCQPLTPADREARPEKPDSPYPPACMAARQCSDIEVRRYNFEVETYVTRLAEYEQQAEAYLRRLKDAAQVETFDICQAH